MSAWRRARLLPLILSCALAASPGIALGAVPQEKQESDHGERHEDGDGRGNVDGISIAITQPVDGATVTSTRIPVTVSWSVESDDKHEKKHQLVGRISLRVDGKDVAFFTNSQHLRSGTVTFENVDLSAAASAKRPAVLVARAFKEKPQDHQYKDSAAVHVTVAAVNDGTPPRIGGLVPAPGSFTNQNRPAISATVTDAGGSGVNATSIVLKLDGAVVSPILTVVDPNTVQLSFTPPSPLSNGLHSLTVDAQDGAGNAAPTLAGTFTIDPTPPVISGLLPASGSVLGLPRPPISGTVTDSGGSGVDPAGVVLRLDGAAVAATVMLSGGGISASVSFTPPAPLSAGPHTITLDARDLAGNAAATAASSFTLDLTAPAFGNPAPAPGSFLNVANPSISATLTDTGGAGVNPSSLQMTLDGSSVIPSVSIVNANQASLTFVPASALAAGLHTVTVSGQDAVGNPATFTWSFTIDLVPPVISGLVPANGGFSNIPKPALSAAIADSGGSGVDGSTVVLKLDGVAVAASVLVSPDFSSATVAFTPATPLADGPHGFTVDAKDRAGNVALTASSSFLVDTLAPALTSPSPPNGATVPSGTSIVSASWADAGSGLVLGSARITVDGTDVTASALISPAGFSFAPAPPLASGGHAVTARIQDRAGNTGTLSWSFLVAGPPSAPLNLTATPGNNQVSLSWAASAGATSYKVFRALASGAYVFSSPLATGVSTTSYTDATAVNGTTYFYVVEATNASGDSGPSNEASAMPAGTPIAPTNLVAIPGNAQVSLTWTASAGALSYKVFRAQVSNGYVFSSPLASGVPTPSYLDLSAVNGTTYFYVVEATTVTGDSGPSNEASATPNEAPAAPVLLNAIAGDGFVSLNWTATTGALTYKVFRSTTSGNYPPTPQAQGLPATSFNDGTVVNGTTYFYVVKATNAAGDSAASNEKFATPTGPTGNGPAVPQITTPPKKTNDTTPLIAGTSDPGVTITVFFNGGADGTTAADATGHWTYHNTSSFKGDGSYRVTATATNAQGTSGGSAGVQIQVDTTPPDVPSHLQASARDRAVVLTWSASSAPDTLGYNIYRKGPQDSEFRKINVQVVTGTHYVDSGLSNGSLYQYRVSAVDDTMNEAHP